MGRYPIPVVILARLAHPLDDDASRFYLRFGFVASPLREKQLLLLLKDARRLLPNEKTMKAIGNSRECGKGDDRSYTGLAYPVA